MMMMTTKAAFSTHHRHHLKFGTTPSLRKHKCYDSSGANCEAIVVMLTTTAMGRFKATVEVVVYLEFRVGTLLLPRYPVPNRWMGKN